MRKKIVGRTGIGIGIFLMFLLFGIQSLSLAENVPIFYEDFANTGLSPAFVAANSKGEYFALSFGSYGTYRSYIIKLDNDLNEIKRWDVPYPEGWNWINEIAIDREDNVWVGGSVAYSRKLFIKFDAEGNYLGYINVSDRKLWTRADLGFVFDCEGNLYFISQTYTTLPMTSTLYKIDSKTGMIIKQWTVPVGSYCAQTGCGVHRGMAINSKGELFWGVWQSPEIYMFNPQTEESRLFALLPVPGGAFHLSIDSDDKLYVMPDYLAWTIQMFDGQGNYVGAKTLIYGNLCSSFQGFGITTFLDEIVVTGRGENLIVKYTSNKESSKEYLYACYGPADTIPPITTLTLQGSLGTDNWYITDGQVNLTAVDNEGGSGVKVTEYSFDGTTWNTYSSPLTISNEGVIAIYYKSTDNAGNVETTKSTSAKFDKTAPATGAIISGTSGSNGWYVSDVTIELIATDTVSGVKAITYSINGTTTIILGDRTAIALTSDGEYNIKYHAVDNAGNKESQKSISINIDKTAPTIASVTASPNILWPPNHKIVDVRIDGSAIDVMSGIASVVITVTDEYGVYNMTVYEFGRAIQLEAWREGTDMDGRHYTITVVATDMAGNKTTAITEVLVPHDMR